MNNLFTPGELAQFRADAESRMVSRCTVRRRSGSTVVDGLEVPAWTVVLTDLPVRVAGADRGGSGTRRVMVGETEVQLAVRVLHFPAATSSLADGDLVEVTSGECAGAVFRLVESGFQDQSTARRVPAVEVDRPEEWS